jgi:hypothetical protein
VSQISPVPVSARSAATTPAASSGTTVTDGWSAGLRVREKTYRRDPAGHADAALGSRSTSS